MNNCDNGRQSMLTGCLSEKEIFAADAPYPPVCVMVLTVFYGRMDADKCRRTIQKMTAVALSLQQPAVAGG